MKKRTLFVLLIAIFLMLIGISLFLFPVFTQDIVLQPSVYTVSSDFQNIEIDLEKTTLTICQDETTYVEIIGYRESEYFISEENGKLLLTDRFEKTPLLFKLSGIGKYFKESRQISQSKSIVLHLSQNDLQTPVNLILKNSTLNLSVPITYLTLHAEHSTLTANDMTFERFNGNLVDCNSIFSFSYSASEFSRNVETHNTSFSINGDKRANAETFVADGQKPSLIIKAVGGSCHLEYQKDPA